MRGTLAEISPKHVHVPVNLAKDFRQAELFRQKLGERVKNVYHAQLHPLRTLHDGTQSNSQLWAR